jgi:hypothetical protein
LEAVILTLSKVCAIPRRLGYGGGFLDRTLAALPVRLHVIGIACERGHVGSIHPQPWDVPVDCVVTEGGVYARREGRFEFLGAPAPARSCLAAPVCYAEEVDPEYFGPRACLCGHAR